jgi:hypothetical protein
MAILYITQVNNYSNEDLHMYRSGPNFWWKKPTDDSGRAYSESELILFQADQQHSMNGLSVPWGQKEGEPELDIWMRGAKFRFRVHHEELLSKDSLYIQAPERAPQILAQLGRQGPDDHVTATVYYDRVYNMTWEFDRSWSVGGNIGMSVSSSGVTVSVSGL